MSCTLGNYDGDSRYRKETKLKDMMKQEQYLSS